jgi:hypothetical protein
MPDPTDPAPADETTMSTNPPPASDATPTDGATGQPRCRMWGCRATLVCTTTAATMLECPRCGTTYAVLAKPKPVTGDAR